MLNRFSDTIIPELYDVFDDKLVELFAVFGGKTIKFPDMAELNLLVDDTAIYNTLMNSSDFYSDLERLSKLYSDGKISAILGRYDKVLSELKQPPRRCPICGKTASPSTYTCGSVQCKYSFTKMRRVSNANE